MPKAGEPCFEIDTGKLKIGDGRKYYDELDYSSGGGDIASSKAGSVIVSETNNKVYENEAIGGYMFVGGPESSAGCRGYYISNIEYDVDPDTGKIFRGEIYLNTNSYDDKNRQRVAVRSRPSGKTNPAKDYPNPNLDEDFPDLGLVAGDEIAIALSG
jgi:hypothetical protein